ncbi:divisome protein SepX/GlpR [Streptosporangium carneum]|uniref:Uncharacterized protein n=1 Tax=Streptosporangium carneum TaxID=47481 RepID=A0A9W6MEF1_9ACTN|nr:hypothetical protein [Streptosporangium carneum]GLK11067.1 hypothetical protein GCM10017600_44730 [Streptosporangium carneum]
MSSVLLYLAIVLMWLCVLVPMWLRRDRATFTELYESAEPYVHDEQSVTDEQDEQTVTEGIGATPDAASPSSAVPSVTPSVSTSASVPVPPPSPEALVRASSPSADPAAGGRRPATDRRRAERRRRAIRVAKRRRLTLWCVLLILASVVTAAVQVIPWWGVAPSVVLLGFYLAVLRVSVQIDTERRRAAAQARAERVRRARRRAELEVRRPVAEIIELAAHRDELFDQYAEASRRAVGD